MAFSSRIGGLLRQSISQNIASNVAAPLSSSLLNQVRMMSSVFSVKLFVGGLPWGTKDEALRELFSSFGEIEEARVVTIHKQTKKRGMVVVSDTGKSRGFGFVIFANQEAALSAVAAMDGEVLKGRNIRVSIASVDKTGPPVLADPALNYLKKKRKA